MYRVLDTSFIAYGLFYDWNGADFAKRAVLEIFRSERSATEVLPHSALSRMPDAVVVMMNPGSSAPLPGFGGQEFDQQLVPAKPDLVQDPVMRLMVSCAWQQVRVVNLADVRAAKSADLYRLISGGASAAELGSLFAGGSVVKPEHLVTAPRVICAWGLDKRLAPLASPAHAWLQMHGMAIHGVAAPAEFPAYRYPKPIGNWQAAVQWLKEIYTQVF